MPTQTFFKKRNFIKALSTLSLMVSILCAFTISAFSQQQTHISQISQDQKFEERAAKPLPEWVIFCEREPEECHYKLSEPKKIQLTREVWNDILAINRLVNQSIIQKTDLEIYNKEDYWTLPYNGEGDCEDFQLLKRHLLVKKGIPARAMRMAVVIDEVGAGHAVLIIMTDRGEFILDNKTSQVKAIEQTPYQYIKRESQNFLGWVSMKKNLIIVASH